MKERHTSRRCSKCLALNGIAYRLIFNRIIKNCLNRDRVVGEGLQPVNFNFHSYINSRNQTSFVEVLSVNEKNSIITLSDRKTNVQNVYATL